MHYLEELNEAQKSAVLATEGAVLVLAGAGAGKTKTIAYRILHLVNTGVPAHRILAITFTNKAAREMRDRVLALLTREKASLSGGGPTVSTFHALSAQILREYAHVVGLNRHFSIFDRADSLRAIKRALKESGEDDSRFEPRTILGAISRAKGNAQTLSVYREEAGNEYLPRIVSEVWARYESILRKEKSLDFDDLLLETWRLLSSNAAVHASLAGRFRYLHVDEYQDTNKVQYEIARMIASEQGNIFCVGDLDQNVYTWRGSTIENILAFEHHFAHATVITLEQNYRSTKTIIAVSNETIKKNKRRKEKNLFTHNAEGEKVAVMVGYDEHDEATKVAARVNSLIAAGTSPDDIALLYRANFQSRALEDAFLAEGLPYRVLGTRFFDRQEVRDLLSYLKAALNRESETDIRRCINVPTRGIGKVTVDKVFLGGRATLPSATRQKVDAFFALLDAIAMTARTENASTTLTYALEHSGITASLSGQGEENRERLENVRELVSLAAVRYDGLPAPEGLELLLADASLATDQDELDRAASKHSAVALMTVHASKGLEFEHVFITGLEDTLFPHERTDAASDPEEERRLFYVALTRAKERVYLSYAMVRTIFGARSARIPSEFLLEIDERYLAADEVAPTASKVIYLE